MISNQILQETLEGIQAITKVDLIVMDVEGRLLAKTVEDGPLDYEDAVIAFAESQAESQSLLGYQFFKVMDDKQLEYIILAKGDSDSTYMVGKMASFQIQSLLVAYKERSDKDNFIKNLLLDNLLLVDIYNRAKKLHIDTDVKRCVFIIETKSEKDNNALETVRNIFSVKTHDFITAVDEKNIILVKEVKSTDTYEDLNKTAHGFTAAHAQTDHADVHGLNGLGRQAQDVRLTGRTSRKRRPSRRRGTRGPPRRKRTRP